MANRYSHDIIVIETTTNEKKATIPVGKGPCALAMTRDGKWVYVANLCSNDITVIETATNKKKVTIPVGNQPCAMIMAEVDR